MRLFGLGPTRPQATVEASLKKLGGDWRRAGESGINRPLQLPKWSSPKETETASENLMISNRDSTGARKVVIGDMAETKAEIKQAERGKDTPTGKAGRQHRLRALSRGRGKWMVEACVCQTVVGTRPLDREVLEAGARVMAMPDGSGGIRLLDQETRQRGRTTVRSLM